MIAFTTIGTNDMPRCQAFYDALLGEIGGTRAMEIPRVTLWAGADGTPSKWPFLVDLAYLCGTVGGLQAMEKHRSQLGLQEEEGQYLLNQRICIKNSCILVQLQEFLTPMKLNMIKLVGTIECQI